MTQKNASQLATTCLQQMLQILHKYDSSVEPVNITGIYDAATTKAVTAFQKMHGIPTTGITDEQTWNAITAVYEEERIDVEPAQPIYVDIGCKERLGKGDCSPILCLAQDMLNLYAQKFKSICTTTNSGILDEPTENALLSFQRLSGLPATGTLDKTTWKHLCLHYCGACAMDSKE